LTSFGIKRIIAIQSVVLKESKRQLPKSTVSIHLLLLETYLNIDKSTLKYKSTKTLEGYSIKNATFALLIRQIFNKARSLKTSMRKHLPNIITLINLFSGCCALVSLLNEQFIAAFIFVLVAGVADYCDGMLARILKVNSPLGKELDSLADLVSFGVFPGAIMYILLAKSFGAETDGAIIWQAIPGFIISLFACLRLARFNLDTRQTDHFIGLNTPAATVFVTGLMLIYANDTMGLRALILQPWLLYIIIAVLSFLLVAEISMISFKFKKFQWKGNESRFIFLILGVVFLIFFKELTFSLVILAYVLYSVMQHFLIKN
jgi:CDP-diacylglycerol--serine O-phosphatidyltransferase